jgi:uncharacterized coiled-coil protein SlyX
MARRASEDAITKSDRWRLMELAWSERFDKLESRISEQNKQITALQSDNAYLTLSVNSLQQEKIRMSNDIATLQKEKTLLVDENVNLKNRVALLEKTLKDINEAIPPC